MLSIKFRFIWPSGFREEDFFQKLTNQIPELPVAIMFVNELGQNEQSLQRSFHRCFLPSFSSFGQEVSEEKNLKKSTNQKQELPVVAMFVNGSGRNRQSLQRTFHRCFYQVSIHLAKRCQWRRLKKNQPIRNKNLPVAAMIVNSVYSLDFIINKYFSNFHKSIQVFVVYFNFL